MQTLGCFPCSIAGSSYQQHQRHPIDTYFPYSSYFPKEKPPLSSLLAEEQMFRDISGTFHRAFSRESSDHCSNAAKEPHHSAISASKDSVKSVGLYRHTARMDHVPLQPCSAGCISQVNSENFTNNLTLITRQAKLRAPTQPCPKPEEYDFCVQQDGKQPLKQQEHLLGMCWVHLAQVLRCVEPSANTLISLTLAD